MSERKEFQLTEAQYQWLLTKRGPVMLIGGVDASDGAQLSANDKWEKLGDFLGFKGMTVTADHRGRKGFFTATVKEPTTMVDPSAPVDQDLLASEHNDQDIVAANRKPEKAEAPGKFRLSFMGPSTSGKWKTDDVPLYATKQEAIDAGEAKLTGDTGAGLEEFKVLQEVTAYGKRVRVEPIVHD